MIAKQISDPTEHGLTDFEKSCDWNSCSHRLRWKRFSTLPWFPESVNSGSFNFILRPLGFLCFIANTPVCGKISSLLESAWVHIPFSCPYFPLWHFCELWTSNMTFIWWLFKGSLTRRRKKNWITLILRYQYNEGVLLTILVLLIYTYWSVRHFMAWKKQNTYYNFLLCVFILILGLDLDWNKLYLLRKLGLRYDYT